MVILGIETATVACSVAVRSGGRLVAERTVLIPQAHSVKLASLAAGALGDAGITGDDLTAVAVSCGPGSFTGLRVGIATAKGLAMGWGKRVVPAPTLDALARTALPWGGPICAALVARRGEVYYAVYDGRDGTRLMGPRTGNIGSVAETVRGALGSFNSGFGGNVGLLGDGAEALHREFETAFGGRVDVFPEVRRLPRAWSVCEVGERLLLSGEAADAAEIKPFYLRRSEAENNLERGESCERR